MNIFSLLFFAMGICSAFDLREIARTAAEDMVASDIERKMEEGVRQKDFKHYISNEFEVHSKNIKLKNDKPKKVNDFENAEHVSTSCNHMMLCCPYF